MDFTGKAFYKTGNIWYLKKIMTYPGTLLKTTSLFARKELGQNFLSDPKTAEMIVNRAGISADDTVLEIGAGLGAITVHAAKRAGQVFAVEKDSRIIGLLESEIKSAGADNVTVINQDIFKVDLHALSPEKPLVVLGNLPYNISSQILILLVENRNLISKAVLMFQKELAERIIASPGGRDYGRLSAVMQYCSRIRTIADIQARLFFPKPDVESRVIEVVFSGTTPLAPDQERFLFTVIKAAFSKRRKTLRNSLSGPELGLSAQEAGIALEKAGLDPARRAETLTVQDFLSLTTTLLQQSGEQKHPWPPSA
ncbi:MAG: 16S rRNA (adenine(1518)-N(6)/adenine(1519)-N(6))-dimethyltransferase RsmA [Pseudomonadota bacterium]